MIFPEPPQFQSDDIEGDLHRLVEWQVSFGPRFPGSEAHEAFRTALTAIFRTCSERVVLQDFSVPLLGKQAACMNIGCVFEGTAHRSESGKGRPKGSLLIGTHFDTRIIADNEETEELRNSPIPGANDGGSGTAVLLHMAPILALLSKAGRLARDVVLVLFDAEDVGNLDGNPFAAGAEAWVKNPPVELPSEMIGLDMVGGTGMVLDVDAHIERFTRSLALTRTLFSLGNASGYRAFGMEKENPYKFIISDHAPFMLAGIPSCILIDIDYPQWHTRSDLPEHVSGASLAAVEDVLLKYLLLLE